MAMPGDKAVPCAIVQRHFSERGALLLTTQDNGRGWWVEELGPPKSKYELITFLLTVCPGAAAKP